MKTRTTMIIFVSILLVGCFIGVSLYTVLKVKIEKGVAKNVSDIPIIGPELAAFPAEGDIQYIYRRYFGGAGIYFTGKVPYNTARQYFDKYFWYNSPVSAYYDEIFTKEPCFLVVPSKENELFEKLPDEKSKHKITIYYMPATETFSGMALISYR